MDKNDNLLKAIIGIFVAFYPLIKAKKRIRNKIKKLSSFKVTDLKGALFQYLFYVKNVKKR